MNIKNITNSKYLLIFSMLMIISLISCKNKKDDFLFDFKIGAPYNTEIEKLKNLNIFRTCPSGDLNQYYTINNIYDDKQLITNHFFNLGLPEAQNLKIYTVQLNGTFYDKYQSPFNINCLKLDNKINKFEILKYLTEIYGTPNYADSGTIKKNPYGEVNILNPILIEPYREPVIENLTNGEKLIKKSGTTDFLYRWEFNNLDIELISSKPTFRRLNDFLVINYKEKGYNNEYQQKIDSIKESYTLDDLVDIKFELGGYFIKNTGSYPFNKKMEITIRSITRKGIAEPRDITNLQFDIQFLDEFKNVLYTLKKFKWDVKIKFPQYDFTICQNLVYSFEYNSNYPENTSLKKLENRKNKATLKPRVTAIRFEDGEVIRKNY